MITLSILYNKTSKNVSTLTDLKNSTDKQYKDTIARLQEQFKSFEGRYDDLLN